MTQRGEGGSFRRQALDRPEVTAAIDDFEGALFAGRRPRIDMFLPAGSDDRLVVLEELAHIDVEYRSKRGETVSIDEYLLRFPELATNAECVERLRRTSGQFAAVDSPVAPLLALNAATDCSSSDDGLPVPERIGRYRVERLIGKGNFGQVYLAFDEQLHRPVAVKVPRAGLVLRAHDAEMYLNEARTVASLYHPHIVPVYDVGTTVEFPFYIVSKFIRGTDLATRMETNRLSIAEVVELIVTVSEALHYAHRQGVFHRAIKPANILIDDEGRPFVVDFGLAPQEQTLGKGSRFAGTPAYMSPEQARGEGQQVDGRSDIFSLGVVFYEAVSGRRPFSGSTIEELVEQITNWEPTPPRQFDDRIPKDLERICLKALGKRTADRYTTARDLADDLRQFLIQLGKVATPDDTARAALPAVSDPNAPGTSDVHFASWQGISLPAVSDPNTSGTAPFAGSATERAALNEKEIGAERRIATTVSERIPHVGRRDRIGEFQILGKLGQGGMGVVYRAWQPTLRRQVALKTLLHTDNVKHQRRFSREIRALGPVRDPHLAEIFSSGTDGDIFYYVMELIEGTTLDVVCEQLQSRGSTASDIELKTWQAAVSTICERKRQSRSDDHELPAERPTATCDLKPTMMIEIPEGRGYVQHVAELVRQVSEAAHKLHEVGAVHRDIKPANIMVCAAGTDAVLIDLGLAQLADETDRGLSRTREFVGTLRYASPEQVLAVGPLDGRSDVYSLGATLWELLTLRPMHNADANIPIPELMRRIEFGVPEPVTKYNGRVPRDLEAIVMKALERNPDHRYQTARELSAELRRFLAGEPVVARPVGRVGRAVRRLRRTTTTTRVLVSVIAVVLPLLASQFAINAQKPGGLKTLKTELPPAKADEISQIIVRPQNANIQLLQSPFENLSEIFDAGVVIAEDHESLIRLQNDPIVTTKIKSQDDFEIEAVFTDLKWNEGQLGIVVDVMDAAGYSVSVSRRVAAAATTHELRIQRRNQQKSLVLRERNLGDIPRGSLKLSLRREGGQLQARVNDSPAMTYIDLFPLGSPETGKVALIWPNGTSVKRIRVSRIASTRRSGLENGDSHFAEKRYDDAANSYEQLLAVTNNESVRQEIRYKQAICQYKLNDRETAAKMLMNLCFEPGERWPLFAACEWCIEMLDQNRWDEADKALTRMVQFRPESNTSAILFERIDNEVFPRYFSNLGVPREARLDKDLIKRLVTLVKIVENDTSDLPRWRRLQTDRRLLSACLSIDSDEEAESLLLRLLDPGNWDWPVIDEKSANMVLQLISEYSGLLIRDDRRQIALDQVHKMQSDPAWPEFAKVGFLLEQARLLAGQENKVDSRKVIDEFIQRAPAQFEQWGARIDKNKVSFGLFGPQLADAWILKGFLADTKSEAVAYWKEGYRRLKSPANMNNFGIAMLSSLSHDLSDDDARAMVKLVAGTFGEQFPMAMMLDLKIVTSTDAFSALREMWSNPRAHEYARKIVLGEISPREAQALQIPLTVAEFVRKGAFDDNVDVELEELIWNTLNDKLFRAYRARQINISDAMLMFGAWQGLLGNDGWETLARRLDSVDRSLRSPLAYFFGCHLRKQGKLDQAKILFGDALKNQSEPANEVLNRRLAKEIKNLSGD